MAPLLDLLLPARCLSCRARAGDGDDLWCGPCRGWADRLRIGLDACCPRCAGPPGRAACWARPAPVDATVAVYRYTGPVADAVVAVKAHGAWRALEAMGQLLAEQVAPRLAADVVTWVPVEPRRGRRRGFDHARHLAGPVAAALQLPAVRLLAARRGLADRGRSPGHGHRLPPDAFRPVRRPAGARILLVDDVVTTGATAAAAAAVLREGGARGVALAALARAGEHPLAAAPNPAGDPAPPG